MNHTSRRSRRRKPMSEINVVPYIDVTFVLLIIFMITAPLQQSAVDVNLPVASGAKVEQKEQPPVIISIQKDGQYYLGEPDGQEKALPLAELLVRVSALQKNNPQIQVYLKGDKAVDYGKVVLVMAALKEAGVPHVGLMTSSLEP
jgi:biopolymer transport protein TolR